MPKLKLTNNEVNVLENLNDSNYHFNDHTKHSLFDILERNDLSVSKLKTYIQKNLSECESKRYLATIEIYTTYVVNSDDVADCENIDDIETVTNLIDENLYDLIPNYFDDPHLSIEEVEEETFTTFKLKPESYEIIK